MPFVRYQWTGSFLKQIEYFRQVVAQTVRRSPTEKLFCPRNIERVVIVRHVHHERADERFLALVEVIRNDGLHLRLDPGGGFRDRLRHRQRAPSRFSMDQAADLILQRPVTDGIRLAGEDCRLLRQIGALVDDAADQVDKVVLVDDGLPDPGIARIEPALERSFVDTRDLMRQGRDSALIVIKSGQPKDDDRDVAMSAADRLFRGGFRSGIGPFRCDRGLFVDAFAGLAGLVDQHGSGEDELLDVEVLQSAEQQSRSIHIELRIERMRLPGEVEVGSQMDDRRDASSILIAKSAQRQCDRIAICQVDRNAVACCHLPLHVDADDRVIFFERVHERGSDLARRAGNENDRLFLGCHDLPLFISVRPHRGCLMGQVLRIRCGAVLGIKRDVCRSVPCFTTAGVIDRGKYYRPKASVARISASTMPASCALWPASGTICKLAPAQTWSSA